MEIIYKIDWFITDPLLLFKHKHFPKRISFMVSGSCCLFLAVISVGTTTGMEGRVERRQLK